MGDVKENALSTANDFAYVRALDSNGNSIRISKADLTSVLERLLGNPIGIASQIFAETNLDEVTEPGIYSIGTSHPSIPGSFYGTFIVIKNYLKYIQQFLFTYNGDIFYRMSNKDTGEKYTSWRKITGTVIE